MPVPAPPTAAAVVPSGGFALELDWATALPELLSAGALVDAAVGYERLAAWAVARQQEMLAEFHRRPADGTVRPAATARRPGAESGGESGAESARREWAVDEIGLALTLAPSAAAGRMAQADRCAGVLRPDPGPARRRADLPRPGPVGRRHAGRVRRQCRRRRPGPGAAAGAGTDLGAAAVGAGSGDHRRGARSGLPAPGRAEGAQGRAVARPGRHGHSRRLSERPGGHRVLRVDHPSGARRPGRPPPARTSAVSRRTARSSRGGVGVRWTAAALMSWSRCSPAASSPPAPPPPAQRPPPQQPPLPATPRRRS